jgi:hypothetical protein
VTGEKGKGKREKGKGRREKGEGTRENLSLGAFTPEAAIPLR